MKFKHTYWWKILMQQVIICQPSSWKKEPKFVIKNQRDYFPQRKVEVVFNALEKKNSQMNVFIVRK